jgi:hypothetical protein
MSKKPHYAGAAHALLAAEEGNVLVSAPPPAAPVPAPVDAEAPVSGPALPLVERSAPPAPMPERPKMMGLNIKCLPGTIDAVIARAHADHTSQKAIICRALQAYGLEIDPSELDDQSGRRYLRLGRVRQPVR